jgi:rSAM/selenodomain-associated transferase 2
MFCSIIVPVLNEEAVLDEALTHLHGVCAGQPYEVLIVDGGSQDASAAIAQRHARVVVAARGRASQMNAGAALSRGDVLLFLHADTRLPPRALTAIELALTDGSVAGGAFRVRFDRDHWPYRLVACATNVRSRVQRIFTGDQAYFIRNSSFRMVGGFPDLPLMEDIEILARLRRSGRFVLLQQYVTTSARRHARFGLIPSVLFMWYLRLLYRCGVAPTTLQRMYSDVR